MKPETTTETATPQRMLRILLALALPALLAVGITVGPAADAVETYRSGAGVGVHGDAWVDCASRPDYAIDVTPVMGTTPGWEWGQNVAFRIYVINARTGSVVRQLNGGNWTSRRIATKWISYDIFGNPATHTRKTAELPKYTWALPAGDYTVRVDYAWHTTGWSYATNVTSSYMNHYAVGYTWTKSAGTLCVIR